MRIDERIAARQHELSPQEKRAAVTLLDHLDDLATYRAAELATMAGVSKATMSRLFRSLGFADFDEVRDHLRSLRSGGEPRRPDDGSSRTAHTTFEVEALRRVAAHPDLDRVIALLAEARRVCVVGWRNSHPVAMHLRQQLAHARDDVRLAPLPGQMIADELVGLGAGDVVVMIGFRRRPSGFAAFLAEAVATGASVVLIADPSAVEHARRATVWLECPIDGRLAFDSYAAAMSLVAILADGVLALGGSAARARVSAISNGYRRLAEIEP